MKLFLTVITGIFIGVLVTLISINWQEEKLYFKLSDSAQFGEILYQNLSITNEGWNPATNIKVIVNKKGISEANLKSVFFNIVTEKNSVVATLDRIRRNETVTIAFSYKGDALTAKDISIKSDRSIAEETKEDTSAVDLFSFLLGFGGCVVLFVFAAIAIPAYKGYIEQAKKNKELEELNKVKQEGPSLFTK